MILLEKVKKLIARHKEIEAEMASAEVASNPSLLEKLSREYNNIGKNLPLLNRYIETVKQIQDSKELLKTESDREIIALATEELRQQEAALVQIEQQVRQLLVPRDPNDYKNAIIEIRAGTGGTEAGIFAADLFKMYSRYAEKKGWNIEILSSSYGDIGAIKEIIFMVHGENAYGNLKFESGIHRVQRVPLTEAQGRVHTSAASVAVFAEADEIDVNIEPDDLRIDVFRAGGKGGQHVNKTESAVRIVHIPSGITVSCQDEKSQHKNKARAMKILQSRLMELMRSKKEQEESNARKSMVGSGDRSEKIRTYNFPQNRLTDHRINLTLYKLNSIMLGDIQEVIDALIIADINQRIKIEKD